MDIAIVQAMLEKDTRIPEITNGEFLVEEENESVTEIGNITVGRNKVPIKRNIISSPSKDTSLFRLSVITGEGLKGNNVARSVNQEVTNHPAVKKKILIEKEAPMSVSSPTDDGEILHEGVYSVLDHWIDMDN